MPYAAYYGLVTLTLGLSVILNTYFLTTNLHWTVGLIWAAAEIVAFALPRAWWSVPIKSMVQLLSGLLTFMFMSSLIQADTNMLTQTQTSQDNTAIRLKQIDTRMSQIAPDNEYTSVDLVYSDKRVLLENKLHRLHNTSFTYHNKRLPESFQEASQDCTGGSKKSAKVTRDYPSVCSDIAKTKAALILLDKQYNSESERQKELSRLTADRTTLVEDLPKLGQNNIKGLTSMLSTTFNISSLADNLLIILTFGVCLVVFAVNLAFSLKAVVPQRFDPKTMGTASGLAGFSPDQVLSTLVIPINLSCSTTEDSKFAAVLAETVRHHKPGQPVNKKTIQSYKKCSNNIAQAVIYTLAYNKLLQKDNQSWQWC